MNTQTVNLDVTKRPSVLPAIYIGQGDMNGTTLVANIYDNGTAFTLDGYDVRFRMKLPYSVATYYVDGTVSGSAATFAIDESYAASVAGVTDTAYVEVLDGDTVVCSTNRMRVVVLESAYEGVPPAHIWDNGITQFLSDAQDAVDAAVDDAEAATSRATAAAEAAEGVVLDAVPTMSPTLKGGAKLGSGLEIESDTLSIDLTDNATGESVTAADASYLASLTVDGKAVQDGTPTPSNPVDVQVVSTFNLAKMTYGGKLPSINSGEMVTANGWSSDFIAVDNTATYFYSRASTQFAVYCLFYDSDKSYLGNISLTTPTALYNRLSYFANWSAVKYVKMRADAPEQVSNFAQLEKSESYSGEVFPYGSIGLKVGSTITPIDLQGNVLASLPDGTKDVLTVDSVGHVVLEKRVGVVDLGTLEYGKYNIAQGTLFRAAISDFVGGSSKIDFICSVYPSVTMANKAEKTVSSSNPHVIDFIDSSYSTTSDFQAAINGVLLYYELTTAQTIDLGYISMPAIPDGSTISITAQVTPTITASWWARGAAAIAEALQAVRARLQALEAAIAELATA